MARTVTLSDIREEIRVRYDLDTFADDTFVTTAAVDSMINKSLQQYYGLLLGCYGDNYFAASAELATSAGVALTSLPDRFAKLLKLHWQRDATTLSSISPASLDDIKLAGLGAVSWSSYRPKFRLSGVAAIEWFPTPNAAYTVRCDYVALPDDLSAEDDTFAAGPGWEEWVVLDVCRKIARREEKAVEAAAFMAERNECEARIRAQAPERDEGEAQQMRDVIGGWESAWERRDRLTLWDE